MKEDRVMREIHRRQRLKMKEERRLGLTDRQVGERIHRSGQAFLEAYGCHDKLIRDPLK